MADKIFSIADGLHDELPSTTTAKAGRVLITTDRGEVYYEPEDKKRIQVNPQADWQQNDETANDYIKNRPGGYEVLTEILPERSLNFTDSNNLDLTDCPPIEVGKKYMVTFYHPNTETTEYERHTYRKGGAVNTAINSAATILGNLSAHGGSDRPNNTALNKCAGVNVAIIIKSVIPTFDTFNESSYKHLVGLPLGQCKKLSTLKGYTKITDLHLEGNNFGQITSKEFSELESLCVDGIILP